MPCPVFLHANLQVPLMPSQISPEQALTSQHFSKALEDAGVALISKLGFGDEGEGYLRFSCANSDDAISEALERIKSWLDDNIA